MSTNPCDLMEAAWDPARREQARQALARQLDQHAPRVGRGTRKDHPMTPARYPGTLAALLPAPDRPNDAWAKSDKPVIVARDIKPAWAGDLARQRRNRRS